MVKLEGVANFREIAGYEGAEGRPMRSGRLFRSGHWGRASDADHAHLRRLGIARVIDFRNPGDLGVDGHDRLPDGVEHLNFAMVDPARGDDIRGLVERATTPELLEEAFGGGKAEGMMREAAAALVEKRCEQYTAFLTALAEPEAPPALFHCSAGKDRAGWAASITLLAIGVSEDDVIDEYLKTNERVQELADANRGPRDFDWINGPLRGLMLVREEYARASFEAATRLYGSIEDYLRDGLALDDAKRDRLRDNLLES